jgi:hypothetical protein
MTEDEVAALRFKDRDQAGWAFSVATRSKIKPNPELAIQFEVIARVRGVEKCRLQGTVDFEVDGEQHIKGIKGTETKLSGSNAVRTRSPEVR